MYYLISGLIFFVLYFVKHNLPSLKSRFYYYPVTKSDYWQEKPNDEIEDVYIDSKDGILHGWYYCPIEPTEYTKIMLMCHGNSGNISTRCSLLADMISKQIPFLIFDYKGFGKSTGNTILHSTFDDAEACLNFLTNEKNFVRTNIIPSGRSIGSYPATRLAFEYNLPKLIIISGLHKISHVIPDVLPGLIGHFASYLAYGDLDVGSYLKKYKGKYILLHSKEDKTVGYHNAVKNSQYGGKIINIVGPHCSNNIDWEQIKNFMYDL